MKELNFSNAILHIDNKLVYDNEINETDAIKIDSSSILFNDIKTEKDITVNYSLTSFSNIYAKKVIVQNELICYGDIICDTLEVYGKLKCYGTLYVKDIEVAKDSIIGGGLIQKGSFAENLIILDCLEVVNNLKVDGNVICNEGILGEGVVQCNKIIANEYIELEVSSENKEVNLGEDSTNSKISLGDLKILQSAKDIKGYIDSKEYYDTVNVLNLTVKKIKGVIPSLEDQFEYEEIMDVLSNLSMLNTEFKIDYLVFKNVLKLSEIGHIQDLVLFLKLVDFKRKASPYIMKISICDDMLNHFVESELSRLYEMNVDSIVSHSEFVKALGLLENNKAFFNSIQYTYILNKIYSKIGIKANMLKKFIQLGDV